MIDQISNSVCSLFSRKRYWLNSNEMSEERRVYHKKRELITLLNLASITAPDVAIITTFDATSDDKFGIMTNSRFSLIKLLYYPHMIIPVDFILTVISPPAYQNRRHGPHPSLRRRSFQSQDLSTIRTFPSRTHLPRCPLSGTPTYSEYTPSSSRYCTGFAGVDN